MLSRRDLKKLPWPLIGEFSYFCDFKKKCMKQTYPICSDYFKLLAAFLHSLRKNLRHRHPATSVVKLKNQTDSLSYSIGIMVASFYKQQGITNINDTMVNKAIKDKM